MVAGVTAAVVTLLATWLAIVGLARWIDGEWWFSWPLDLLRNLRR